MLYVFLDTFSISFSAWNWIFKSHFLKGQFYEKTVVVKAISWDFRLKWPEGKTSKMVIELTPGYILYLGFISTYE